MLVAALIINILVLLPVIWSLGSDAAGAGAVFGPDTQARRILIAVYVAIALASAGLLALHGSGHDWAVPMTVALFCVQIIYKLLTVPLVGVASPVVMTNLIVVAIQIAALALLFATARN